VTLLPGRGWRRARSARAAWANAEALGGAAAAVVMAIALFARWRPAVVVSLGGYASFPCVVAAVLFRVPVVVVNLDAVPGVVNRLAAKFAAASFTGVPVRAEMAHVDRSPEGRRRARERLGLPLDAKVVAASGGSLGSLRINHAVAQLAELWAARNDVAVRHVVGRRDWGGEFGRPRRSRGPLVYQAVPYEEDMAGLYSAADVAVQRAGASTVAELALAGVPSVLVPLPGAPGDHQRANARAMEAAGGARVVDDALLDGERLARELDSLLRDPALLSRMGEAARTLARPQAASEIADLIERCARGGSAVSEKEVACAG
jgi:UDP-N-acetylglucosamine--N-acetylmuramyl-(pentapeptide) pyrophosphoryl-undecaprenol N-acetylglucosamine transferase